MCGLETVGKPIDDALVPVVATKAGVAMGRLHFEHTVADFENRNVERAATEVEHKDRLIGGFFVESVRECCCGRLVDDAKHLEAGDLARLFGCGALRVVEVRGHGDDGLGDSVTEVGLGIALELHERASGNFLSGIGLAIDVDGPVSAHMALDRTNGAVGVGDGLTLGHFADENLAVLCECDH
ncbi:unannotated protein [freshwater metagenome]|uniref:Unannotated protein n=1 Tax=freshwater metagenome TaxID=449393 RepID=A0A6J7JLD3_9ZZZZ